MAIHLPIPRTAGLRAGIGLLVLGVTPFGSGAAPSPRPPMQEPTKIGRPANFSQAVGSKFTVELRATPTTLKAGDRITLTIRVIAQGAWQSPPRRPDLGKLRAFTDRFDIQHDAPAPDRQFRKPPAWEFTYTLKPRNAGVKEVPPLLFVYYKPGTIPPEKGYRTIDAGPIALTIEAAPSAPAAEPIRAPEALFQRAASEAVLRPMPAISLPLVIILFLGPPALCLAWYLVWCRLYPDAARLVRQRRSVAAGRALGALRAVGRGEREQQASRTATILTEYLRHRLDLAPGEATPAEVALHLERVGFSIDLASKAAELVRICDQARFAPHADINGHDLPAAAAHLILALEAEPCPRAS